MCLSLKNLMFIIKTVSPILVELIDLVNSVIVFPSQMILLRWLTDSHSPALFDLFTSSDASICTTMTFPPVGNSEHVVASVSIDFQINSK